MSNLLPYEIVYLAGKGDIKIEEAAQRLNMTPRAVAIMVTKWDGRNHLLLQALKEFKEQPETIEDVAARRKRASELLGITERQVNRLLAKSKIERKRPKKVEKREELAEMSQNKWETRQKYAICIIDGTMGPDEAGLHAEVSSRQMYRWATKLLAEEGLAIKDLHKMTDAKRRTLANRIEKTHARA